MTKPLSLVSENLRALASHRVTSRELVEQCLAAATDPSGEGSRTFVQLAATSARDAADASDRQRKRGIRGGLLMGLPLSVKDIFDISLSTTTAGSTVLANMPPATHDALVIKRLRKAGAVLIGRTNMTEFAFSGIGLNPHFGTPRNPHDRSLGRIPGGSSSGAAVSVSDGMSAAAIGTDTGGSVRIPAALCGLTGFKPTARRVPLDRVLPLSPTLDSVGPIAHTVTCCALVDSVLADTQPVDLEPSSISSFSMGVLHGYVLEDLDVHVARCFENAISILSKAGARVYDIDSQSIAEIPAVNARGGFPAVESYRWHHQLIERHGEQYDPRVLSRILRGKEFTQCDYEHLIEERHRIITQASRAFGAHDIWLLPTVPRIAPPIAELESSDSAYFEANAAMLRNPSVINFLDGCALSIPCHKPGEAPVGIMVAALGGSDEVLLRAGAAIESSFAHAGLAISNPIVC